MPSLEMGDTSYNFNRNTIIEYTKNYVGNYALGVFKDGTFYPKYVGRSDTGLQNELIVRLDEKGHLPHFKFSYASSVRDAYQKECKNYHDFTGLENKIHPASPQGLGLTCACGR